MKFRLETSTDVDSSAGLPQYVEDPNCGDNAHNPETTPPAATQVLLIDLENCPNQINKLLNDLEQFSHVVICYAQSGAKIPLDWLLPLTAMINASKLHIQKMPGTGKNAADFGISFFAGALMQQLPVQTHFVIVSEDTDLEHVVRLLNSLKVHCGQDTEKAENIFNQLLQSYAVTLISEEKINYNDDKVEKLAAGHS